MRINKSSIVVGFLLGAYFSYFALAFVTDLRIHELRPFITKSAVDEGVAKGIETYKKEYEKGLHLSYAKRKARDEAVKQYIKKLDSLMWVP